MNGNGNRRGQIVFPGLRGHSKAFEMAVVLISVALAILVLVIVLFTNIGNEFRPSA